MRKQDYLLHLIKSLSPSEKRYFSIFCQSDNEGTRYMRLFNLLETLEEYNPAQIAKTLNITPAKLAHEKEYLQQVLLRNLRLFNESHLGETSAMAEYMEAEMLYLKGMGHYCISKAEKLLVKAVEHEWFLIAQQITRLLSRAYYQTAQWDHLLRVNKRETEITKAYQEFIALLYLRDEFIKPVMTRKNFGGLKKLSSHPLLKLKSDKLKSLHAAQCSEEIWMYYYQYVQPQPEKALQHARQRLNIFLKNKKARAIMPASFFITYNALAMRLQQNGRYAEALNAINSLIEETQKPAPAIPMQILQQYNVSGKLTKISLLIFAHRFAEAKAFGEEVYDITTSLLPGHRITFLLSYATALFYTGNLNECHQQLNLITNSKITERVDIQLYARLLFIMLQLQLKNYSLIPYQVKSVRTWKKRAKIDEHGLNELLAWFDKLGKAGSKQQWPMVFNTFIKEVQDKKIFSALDIKLAFSKWQA